MTESRDISLRITDARNIGSSSYLHIILLKASVAVSINPEHRRVGLVLSRQVGIFKGNLGFSIEDICEYSSCKKDDL
jgi:hypothetical protein